MNWSAMTLSKTLETFFLDLQGDLWNEREAYVICLAYFPSRKLDGTNTEIEYMKLDAENKFDVLYLIMCTQICGNLKRNLK